MRFAYFYLMKDEPEGIGVAVPRHVSHWHGLAPAGYVGGPFEDRSGGLITFEADDVRQAVDAVESDPFVEEGLLAAHWLKRWTPE